MNRDIAGQRFEREAILETRRINLDDRTVPAALSSETPVRRFYGQEILVHTEDAIELSRAEGGLPLLWKHDDGQPIGLVEKIRVQDGKLRGVLRFSDNPKATEIFNDVRQGFLKNVSIGYTVDRYQ